jgi:hypothetical protein
MTCKTERVCLVRKVRNSLRSAASGRFVANAAVNFAEGEDLPMVQAGKPAPTTRSAPHERYDLADMRDFLWDRIALWPLAVNDKNPHSRKGFGNPCRSLATSGKVATAGIESALVASGTSPAA